MEQVEILKTPIKAKGDKKEYRLIRLKNGLKALLIKTYHDDSSNSTEEINAAASLLVKVGSYDESEGIGGLAHFLEHMIFMGNEKYPEESGFNDFVTANGGKRNAMTSDEYTLYFFDIVDKALPEGLDRFANMFISPLLLKNAMQREREAVDSEYQMAISNEAATMQTIIKMLINDEHPASKFDFGNLKTLKEEVSDGQLHTALLNFYHKYVAEKMYVCVQSYRSLDELQELVVEKFSAIRTGSDNGDRKSSIAFENIFKPSFHEKVFYAKPRVSKKAMVLSWAIPGVGHHENFKPLTHISSIFENSGEGGISSYLKDKNLVTNFIMFPENEGFGFNSDFCFARLATDLTDYGMENLEKIFEAIFSYLLMLKEAPIEEHRRLFEQKKRNIELSYVYYQERSAMTNVKDYITNFLFRDDSDLLRRSFNFKEDVLTDVINRLNQLKFNVFILDEKHENYPNRTKYFDAEYDEIDFPEKFKTLWENRKLNSAFFLEKPNPFIATNFDLYVIPEESQKYPVKVLDSDLFEVWHKLDDKFKVPKVDIEIELYSPVYLDSIHNYLALKIFDSIFSYHVEKKFAQATSANLRGSTNFSRGGLSVTFSGYNEKIESFIDIFTQEFRNINEIVTERTFNQFRVEQKDNLSISLKSVRNLGGEYFGKIIVDKFHLDYDMYQIIDQLTYEDVQKFIPKFLQQLKIKMLALGNITKAQVLNVAAILERNLECRPHGELDNYEKRGYQLPLGTNMLRVQSLMPNDDNSYIKVFYQIGFMTLKKYNMGRMLKAMIDPKVYDILRSKWQLGYAVGCNLENNVGVLGLTIIVLSQEHKHPFTEVYEKIEKFVTEIVKTSIDELSDEEFEKFKDAHIKELQSELLSLGAESNDYWPEIKKKHYLFNRKALSAELSQNITKRDLQDFYHSFMDPENRRVLSVQAIGNEQIDNSINNNLNGDLSVNFLTASYHGENVITNIEEFQKDLFLFPVLNADHILEKNAI